jgi:hypothetical protein
MGPLRPLWLRIANDRSCALAPSVIAWGAHGMSGAEGRPAVPLTWRRQPPLTPQPTFTKTQSRGSSWVERLSASVFFFDDGYAPFPTIHKTDVGGRGQ